MNTRYLLMSTLVAIIMTACGGEPKPKTAEADPKQSAKNIIVYTNRIVDYLNGTGDWLRDNKENITKLIDSPRKKIKPSKSDVTPFTRLPQDKRTIAVASASLSKEDQEFFTSNVTEYISRFESILRLTTKMKSYYVNEEYKDDKFTKGWFMADSIETHQYKLLKLRAALFDKIDLVAADAELIILENHPLRKPILEMKSTLVDMDTLRHAFITYYKEKTDVEKLESLCMDIDQKISKNKELHKDILDDYQSDYDLFYKKCGEVIENFRKIALKCKNGEKITEKDIRKFDANQRNLIVDYNNFNK